MKEKLLIFAGLIGVIVLMVVLNAATYVQKVKQPDNEFNPNRSTFNPGATGSLAFYTLLSETGRNVSRWQLPLESLSGASADVPHTFVMIGPYRRDVTEEERNALLTWVADGGRLVLIDRIPDPKLAVTTTDWKVSVPPQIVPDLLTVDPANQNQMTDGTDAVKPAQPSVFTVGVNAVQPSRFASAVRLERDDYVDTERFYGDPEEYSEAPPADDRGDAESPPPPVLTSPPTPTPTPSGPETAWFKGPVAHLTSSDRNILVDMPYGEGEIVILSDPFIVSNGGINMADNAHLAVNVVAAGKGNIAFDEYHHGFGAGNNRVLEYFEGTPVTAIFLQLIALIGFVLYSRSRRFARPVPEPEPDRLSKLEYVSAMAELQLRTGSYDLAMENIYSDFRRRAARHFGIDNSSTTRAELAGLISERTGRDAGSIEALLFKCEDIIHGEPVSKRTVLALVNEIRELEIVAGINRKVRAGI